MNGSSNQIEDSQRNDETNELNNGEDTANTNNPDRSKLGTSGFKIFKVKKNTKKKKKEKRDKDDEGDSSTPIESDNEGEKQQTERMEDTVKTEKLSTHLNTVREKYKKQRATLIKDLEADEIGKFMMADKITF